MVLFKKCICRALRKIRLENKKTQEYVAEQLSKMIGKNIRQAYVSKIENGNCSVSIKRLGYFCRVLGCPPHYVVSIAEKYYNRENQP